jgi:catechol 2,3-dioxygenase-like lactoylglutathione lyase family enzyme
MQIKVVYGNTNPASWSLDRPYPAGSKRFGHQPALLHRDPGRPRYFAGGTGDGYFWADELFVTAVDSSAALGALTGRHHLAFQAQDCAMVDSFYQAALANGGKDNGAPGERNYHPGYYAAFVFDPDGNNIEAVYHGEAKRSVGSVEIRF